jgi:hypothetical protein
VFEDVASPCMPPQCRGGCYLNCYLSPPVDKQVCDLHVRKRRQQVLHPQMLRWSGLRRLRAGPSLLGSSVAVGATAFSVRRGERSCRLASRGGDCPRWSFAPHWTRRSVPALGIYGIDEDSSLPRSGIAMRPFSDPWRVEQTPSGLVPGTRHRGQPRRSDGTHRQ